MEINTITNKIKCELPGCKNLAEHSVSCTDNCKHNFNLCKECLTELHKQFSRVLTPKSIKNVYQKGGINGKTTKSN